VSDPKRLMDEDITELFEKFWDDEKGSLDDTGFAHACFDRGLQRAAEIARQATLGRVLELHGSIEDLPAIMQKVSLALREAIATAIDREREGPEDDEEFYPCGHQKSAGGIEQHDCKD